MDMNNPSKPTSISILGQNVRIQYMDLEDMYGCFEQNPLTIKMDKGLEGEAFERVLFHELFHAVVHISGLSELLAHDLEEALATACEYGLKNNYKRK